MMIEVFITNVTKKKDSAFLRKELLKVFPNSEINFDLEELRQDPENSKPGSLPVKSEEVIFCLGTNGFECKILTD